MKAVLLSIQPYYVFLIIARIMGWNIPQEKTVEVRKDRPKDDEWNKETYIYCSKNKKSFNRIPEQYQPFMKKLMGKVVGVFICDKINELYQCHSGYVSENACISRYEFFEYLGIPYNTHFGYDKKCYGWRISDLKIYDTPKELREFKKAGYMTEDEWLYALYPNTHCHYNAWVKKFEITRPPQSWYYITA